MRPKPIALGIRRRTVTRSRLALLAWLATVGRLWRVWPILLVAMISTATLGALFWHLLRTAQYQVG
ncbi:hypothetical protein [Actinoplanes sp. NPDC049316]|uniref:hypothetical protein n=1 Tax=Actinoplanes sp. NPDC049316 TaxID=3154727 RepID=UPI00341CC883